MNLDLRGGTFISENTFIINSRDNFNEIFIYSVSIEFCQIQYEK
jgi:hypothetical protein